MTLGAILGLGRAERCVCGAGHHGPLGDPGAGALDGRPAARRPRVPPWRRPLRRSCGRNSSSSTSDSPAGASCSRSLAASSRRRVSASSSAVRSRGLRRPGQARLLRCRARHGGRSRAGRSPARGALPLRAATERCRRTTPGRSGYRRRGDLLLRWPRPAGLHDLSRADTRRSFRSSTRRRFPRWAAWTSSRCTCSSGVSSSVRLRHRGLLHRSAPAWLLWPPLRARPGRAARSACDCWPLRRTCWSTSSSSSAALLLALWLPRLGWRGGSLCRGVVRRRRADEARGLVFAASVARRSRSSPRAGRRASPRRRSGPALVGAVALPWRLWTEPRDRRRGAADVGVGGSVGRIGDALRLSFDVSLRHARWSVVPMVALIAVRAALVRGDRRVAGFLAAVLGVVFLGGAWSTYSYRDVPITADEALNPIVRYTGAIVLLAAATMPLVLASVWRGRRGAPMTRTVRTARRRDDRRRARSSAIRRSCRRRGCALPVRDDCVRPAPPGESSEPSTSCSVARHARRSRAPARATCSPSGTSTRRCGRTGADGWKVVYTGSSRTEQGASSAAEARGAGLDARLEIQPPG